MSYIQLAENERYQIYAMIKAGIKQNKIARLLNGTQSTISRELKRNKGLKGYRPAQAQRFTDTRRREAFKSIKITDEVWGWIVTLIQQELSPATGCRLLEAS